MTQMEGCTKKRRGEHSAQVLFYDTSGRSRLNSGGFDLASSPVECLAKAIDDKPSIIVIHFAEPAMREREALVELCGVLKCRSFTQGTPLLALLHFRHRRLLENLSQAGVDYVKYIDETPLNSPLMNGLIESLGPNDLIERQLARVCPYLRYTPIDAEREMVVCGAYLDRLVLGRKWLRDLCEVETHQRCEYYLNPRVGS